MALMNALLKRTWAFHTSYGRYPLTPISTRWRLQYIAKASGLRVVSMCHQSFAASLLKHTHTCTHTHRDIYHIICGIACSKCVFARSIRSVQLLCGGEISLSRLACAKIIKHLLITIPKCVAMPCHIPGHCMSGQHDGGGGARPWPSSHRSRTALLVRTEPPNLFI